MPVPAYSGRITAHAARHPDPGPLGGHASELIAVAAAALPDVTPVIITGHRDGTLWAWWLPDGVQAGEPLDLSESVGKVAAQGNIIVTAAGPDIAAHQLALPPPNR